MVMAENDIRTRVRNEMRSSLQPIRPYIQSIIKTSRNLNHNIDLSKESATIYRISENVISATKNKHNRMIGLLFGLLLLMIMFAVYYYSLPKAEKSVDSMKFICLSTFIVSFLIYVLVIFMEPKEYKKLGIFKLRKCNKDGKPDSFSKILAIIIFIITSINIIASVYFYLFYSPHDKHMRIVCCAIILYFISFTTYKVLS